MKFESFSLVLKTKPYSSQATKLISLTTLTPLSGMPQSHVSLGQY